MDDEGAEQKLVELGESLGNELTDISDSFRVACEALGGELSGAASFSQGVDIATGDAVITANFNGACKVPSSGMDLP